MKKKQAIKDVLYGSMLEMSHNRNYFYRSQVGTKYCHWTDEGKEAIIHVVEDMFRGLQIIHQAELKEEAKRQTMDALK